MKQDIIDSMKKMNTNGNRLELPTDEHFNNYPQVKKCLLAAGKTGTCVMLNLMYLPQIIHSY